MGKAWFEETPEIVVEFEDLIIINNDKYILLNSKLNDKLKKLIFSELSKLTDDDLILKENTVKIKKKNNGSKVHGTKLIRDLIEHERRTLIIDYDEKGMGSYSGPVKDNWKGATKKGIGSDSEVVLSNNNGASIFKINNKTYKLYRDLTMTLGHELIHSLIQMNGDSMGMNTLKKPNFYTAPDGVEEFEKHPIPELKTTGLNNYRFFGYPTENDLRKENKKPIRVSYGSGLTNLQRKKRGLPEIKYELIKDI